RTRRRRCWPPTRRARPMSCARGGTASAAAPTGSSGRCSLRTGTSRGGSTRSRCGSRVAMAALVDLFAYLAVLLPGAVLVLQALAVGGVAFELLVSGPGGGEGRPEGRRASRRLVSWIALGLAAAWLLWLGLDSAVLLSTSDLGPADLIGATYVTAGAVAV